MRLKLWIAILVFLASPSFAWIAVTGETAGSAEYRTFSDPRSDVIRIDIAWVSNATGDCTFGIDLYGDLLRVSSDPGTASPTAAYDLDLLDSDSINVLGTAGDNLSATASASTTLTAAATPDGYPLAGTYTFDIDAAGDSKEGVIRFFIRR